MAPDSWRCNSWSFAPPLLLWVTAIRHTPSEDPGALLPILEGVTAGALLLNRPLHRGVTTQVAPGLPLDRSGRRAGAKRPDVLL